MEEYQKRIYQSYLSSQGRHSDDMEARRPYLQSIIHRHFPADRNAYIVDLGCGMGSFVHFLRSAGYTNVIGVDISAEQVAAAAKMGIRGIVQEDFTTWLHRCADASLDVAISFDTIEHMTKPELLACADEICRVLKPGGLWIVHTANAEGVFGGRVRWADLTHEQAFTRDSLGQVFAVSGFEHAAYYEDAPVVHGVMSFGRRAFYTLFRWAVRIYWIAETGERSNKQIFSQNILAISSKNSGAVSTHPEIS
jgi:2-polyprenyl-3-methyl-5-hydroxy-6-metoxy-1,4-benzoquinol methylase